MTIPNDYIVGGNGSFCIDYIDGCGICEGIEISCLLRLNMNILLYVYNYIYIFYYYIE